MNFFAARFRWLNFSGTVLVALLQRAPVVRVVATAAEAAFASPMGAMLRAAVATTASLGALHTLAGATQLVVSATAVNGTVGTAITSVAFTTTGAPSDAGSFTVRGTLPPGLAVPGLNSSGILNDTKGRIAGTPTTAGSFLVTIQAWENASAGGGFSTPVNVLFTITDPGTTTGPPSITAQPQSVTTAVDQSVSFNVGVKANPAATYQWLKNGAPISGATGASLAIAKVAFTDAGNYFVNVTNSFGTVQSATVTLNVLASALPPTVTLNPQPQTIAPGSTIVFTAAANAVPAPTYQWYRNSVLLAGATSPTLVLTGTSAVAGSYVLVASNDVGQVGTNAAVLTVASTANPGRLINLSILAPLAVGETMTMGTVLGGAGTSGSKALLARAAGPPLLPLGVNGVLPDPRLALIAAATGAAVATNNDWGTANFGNALGDVFTQVGAFAFSSTASKDAAIYQPALAVGNYTVQVNDTSGGSGNVIAELYDATPSGGAFAATTPRLINVSVLKNISAGAPLTAGFVIGGATSRTVLVRAIGPGIAGPPFNVPGTMSDPQLTLFNSSQITVASNNDWGGDQQITDTGTSVGAFKIANALSKDAMLLVTLAPGNYTAQVSGGAGGGTALVEVYEVP